MRTASLLALLALAMFSLAAGPKPAPSPAAAAKPAYSPPKLLVDVTFLETASRVKLGKESLALALDGRPATHAVKGGGSLEGFTLKTFSRTVRVNDGPEGSFLELTVFGKDGAEAGYVAVTVPQPRPAIFSAAIKLRAETDLTLVLGLP